MVNTNNNTNNNHNTNNNQVVVLNVAEKPSVARALAAVFGQGSAMDRGMRRDAHQIFTHDNVRFPNVYAQGNGQRINGPSK
jgi:DNA topoisomerase-3